VAVCDCRRSTMSCAARRVLGRYLPVTPMWSYPALSTTTGATTFVKHEHVQPTGAFKVRGGIFLVDGMTPADRAGRHPGLLDRQPRPVPRLTRPACSTCRARSSCRPTRNPGKAAAVRGAGRGNWSSTARTRHRARARRETGPGTRRAAGQLGRRGGPDRRRGHRLPWRSSTPSPNWTRCSCRSAAAAARLAPVWSRPRWRRAAG